MADTIIKKWNTGTSVFDELYPRTTHSQIVATGTASSTTALFGDGSWKTAPDGSGGASNRIAYWSGTNTLGGLSTITYPSLTELSYVKGVTSALQTQIDGKQDTLTNPVTGTGTANQIAYYTGSTSLASLTTSTYPSLTELSYVKGVTSAIQTQLGNKATAIVKYKASATNNATTTPAAVTTVTLLANKYYQLNVVGMYSKASTSGSTAIVVSCAVDNTTGTPTLNGVFDWLNTPTATAYTTANTNGSITTTTTTRAFTMGVAALTAITTAPFSMRGLFYSGTSDKVLTFYVYQSVSASGNVTVDNISITATELAA